MEIFPAGAFKAKSSKINGRIIVRGEEVSARRITIPIDSFTTDIGLRDEHFKKYLKMDEHPRAELTELKGKNLKARGKLQIAGVLKEMEFDYTIRDNKVHTTFIVNVTDFGLTKAQYLNVGVSEIVKVTVVMPIDYFKDNESKEMR